MILKHKIAFVKGDIDTERVQLISVHNPKYGRIDLCFKANMHIPFAKIKLHSTDTYGDAKKVENDAARLGNEMAKRWNEHGKMVEVLTAIAERYKDGEKAVNSAIAETIHELIKETAQ